MDWVGVALNLLGTYLLARHRFMAMAIFLVANALWAVWATANGVWSILVLQACFAALNVRALVLWRMEA